MMIKSGNAPITLDTLLVMKMVKVVRTPHGTHFHVIGASVPPAILASPPSPVVPHSHSTPLARPSTSHGAPLMSLLLYWHWLGRNIIRIVTHLGVQLSLPPSSPIAAQRYVEVDTANLESEAYESFDSYGGNDSWRGKDLLGEKSLPMLLLLLMSLTLMDLFFILLQLARGV